MATIIRGPAWSRPGLDVVGGRYPLRVERHLGRLVDGLLPGVISTTPHARSFALHTLVWAEAADRGLDHAEAVALMRRCEVVLAGVTLLHEGHLTWIPDPHGGGVIKKAMEHAGLVEVAKLARPQAYSQNSWGFAGVYLGSELRLGLVEHGRPPTPGRRADLNVLKEALGEIVELASKDSLDPSALKAVPHLCACGAPAAADGPWLRSIFVRPDAQEDLEEVDRARRETAQLLGRALSRGSAATPHEAFQHALAFGDFILDDALAASLPIAQAWRGAVLRNYSVGAWRRIWSWVVEMLGEPASVDDLADQLAEALPEMTVSEMLDSLPPRVDDRTLLPAEDQLRSAQWAPDPFTEVRLLALGGLRLEDLEGRALSAFAGREDEDDLGPRWFRAQLEARRADSLRTFGRWLAEMMVLRAQRVALTKMDFNRTTGRFWIPSRIRERAGLISRLSREGWFDVGLRIDTFSSVLAGCGVLERGTDGVWRTTEEGDVILG